VDVVRSNETELDILLRSVVFFADPKGYRELPPVPKMEYKFVEKTRRLVQDMHMPMAGRYCRLREDFTTYRTGMLYNIDFEKHRRNPTKYPAPASYLELINQAGTAVKKPFKYISATYSYDALFSSDDDYDDDCDDDGDYDDVMEVEAEDEEDARMWESPENLLELYYPKENIFSGNEQAFDCVNRLIVEKDGHQHVEQGVYLISRHTNKWNFNMNDEGLNRLTVWEYDPLEGTNGAMSMVFCLMDNDHNLITYVQDLCGVTNLRVTYPGGARFYTDSYDFSHYVKPTIFQLRTGSGCGAHCRVFPCCVTCVRRIETVGEVTRLYSNLDSFDDRHYLFEFPRNDLDVEMIGRNTINDVESNFFTGNVKNDENKLVIATKNAKKWYRVHKKDYVTAVSESVKIQNILDLENQEQLLRLRNDNPSNLCNVELKVMNGLLKGMRYPLRFTEAIHVDENPPFFTEAVYAIGNSNIDDLEGPLRRITFFYDSVAPRHCTISVDKYRRVWLQIDFKSGYTVMIKRKHSFFVMTSGRSELKNGDLVVLGKEYKQNCTADLTPVELKVRFKF
jgi:hypothetical protein